MDADMKRRMIRLFTLFAVAAAMVTLFTITGLADSAEGGSIDSYSIYAGTQTDSSGAATPGWQTAQIGYVNQCPSEIKLWRGDNGLWLSFEYYHAPEAIKPLEIRLRADKWNAIATMQAGRLVASSTYFAGEESDRLIADLGDAYGWHHVSVKINQDVTVSDGRLVYSWDATFSVDGGAPVTFVGDPACLGVGAAAGTAPVWKLYDAALSPEGDSVDYEKASAAPSTASYLRFYFYGGGFYNNDSSERSLLRIRNVRTYYGDSAESVYGLDLDLGGGRLVTNATVDAVCSATGSFVASAYHKTYATYEYLHFVRAGESTALPTPVREGCLFDGWYLDPACTSRVESTAGLDRSVTLYAAWKSTATVVSYDLDGGSFDDASAAVATLAFGSTSFTVPDPKKEGHEFLGWLLPGETTPVKGSISYTATASEPTLLLRAVWNRIYGTVRYVMPSELSIGGSYTTSFPIGEETDVVFPVVWSAGFCGWYLTEDFSGEPISTYRIGADATELVFYAKYVKVFFDSDFSQAGAPAIEFLGDLKADGVAASSAGLLHWSVPDGDCSSHLPIGDLSPESGILTIELSLMGSVVCSPGEVRLRLRSGSGTGDDTNVLVFDGGLMKIGESRLGELSDTTPSTVVLQIRFVSGGLLVDGYLDGRLVVDDELIFSRLGTVGDGNDATVDCTRFNWYVGKSGVIDLYIDYLYIADGDETKYSTLG